MQQDKNVPDSTRCTNVTVTKCSAFNCFCHHLNREEMDINSPIRARRVGFSSLMPVFHREENICNICNILNSSPLYLSALSKVHHQNKVATMSTQTSLVSMFNF